MIIKKTVFVLGAGASKPFGFPSGLELKHFILDQLEIRVSPMRKMLLQLIKDEDEIVEFCKSLKKSGLLSVDAFLEHRKEFEKVGKLAIAYSLIGRENEEMLYKRNVGETWYEYIFGKMNAPFEIFGNNQISFITFNYDRSLEHFLFNALYSLSKENKSRCAIELDKISINHVYGNLCDLPWKSNEGRPYSTDINPSILEKAHRQIFIISDENRESSRFTIAHHFLNEAEYIYFLGFGYNDVNLRRLKISDLKNVNNLFGSAKGIGLSDQRRITDIWKIQLNEATNIEFLQNQVSWSNILQKP